MVNVPAGPTAELTMMDNTEQATTFSAALAALDDMQSSPETATEPLPAAPPRKTRNIESEAGKSEMSTEDQRLATFVGYNTDAYLQYYHDVYSAGWKAFFLHWHWAPCAFAVPWLFMRRRFGAGLVLLIAVAAIGFLMPGGQGTGIALAGGALLCGFAGRPFYIWSALRAIQVIEARRLWPVQRDEKLRRSGALSIIGGFLGAVLWVAALAAPYYSQYYL